MNMKKTIIFLGILLFTVGLFCGIATGTSRKNRQTNPVRINYKKSFFQDFTVEDNIVKIKCNIYIYNISEQDKKFYIRATSSEDVGKLLNNEDLRVSEDGEEKVFELKANESNTIDVIFEGEFGGINQKVDRLLPNNIEIIYSEE